MIGVRPLRLLVSDADEIQRERGIDEREAIRRQQPSAAAAREGNKRRRRRNDPAIEETPTLHLFVYDADAWTEVAKYLNGRDLVRLSLVNRWFNRLIAEQSIWKHAFLRDLHVPPPSHVSFPWNRLYASAFDGSHAYTFRQGDSHIDWVRIGAFYFDSTVALLSEKLPPPRKLPRPEDDPVKTIEAAGTCLLTNARSGIWIADLQLVRCPVCNLSTCEGTMQVLDTRHAELFLEEGFKDGSWVYEDIGSHRIEEPSAAAAAAIFDVKHLAGPCTAGVLDAKAWMGKQDDWQPKARLSLHAVAVNTNLQPNQGDQTFE
ncbi:putative F-box protein [Canna indica]|uniref:F-box protein n=1 Tax=Canna indica TaxID=4628 RepID=A0AAQ3Q5U4_9LILI|nr:putative F-box protein [Canna indica]